MLSIENLKKLLQKKSELIKELENKLKVYQDKIKELKDIKKEKNKEVLNEKVEQGN